MLATSLWMLTLIGAPLFAVMTPVTCQPPKSAFGTVPSPAPSALPLPNGSIQT